METYHCTTLDDIRLPHHLHFGCSWPKAGENELPITPGICLLSNPPYYYADHGNNIDRPTSNVLPKSARNATIPKAENNLDSRSSQSAPVDLEPYIQQPMNIDFYCSSLQLQKG